MAADGPISSFPMDREAAEEEIALLVRKPGFDELTPADIVRHMNTRFNIEFDKYKSQLKTMVIQEINKRNEENGNGSDSSSGGSSSESDDSEDDEEKEKKEKPKTSEKAEKREAEPVAVKKEETSDSDDDDILDRKPIKKTARARSSATADTEIAALAGATSRRAAASNAMKQIRSSAGPRFKSTKKKEKDPNEDNSGKFGRMTKLCYISPELQQITGDQYMKRCDVVKKLWNYIDEHNLKDPKARQFILCNDLLQSIFNKKRLKGFGMMKFLTRHIIGPNDMSPDIREESEREMQKRKAEWLERKRKREAEEIAESEAGPSEKKPKKEEVESDGDDSDSD